MSSPHDHEHPHALNSHARGHGHGHAHGHAHGHHHAIPSTTNQRALAWALALTSAFLMAEVTAGFVFKSLALLSDAAHMFTDAAALGIALAALRLAQRPADAKRTYGYHRFEILAAAFNALLLFSVAVFVLVEAWRRVHAPVVVQPNGMLAVAALGLVVNLVCMRVLSAGKDANLNMKGAYLEVWSDMLGSLGVMAGAIVIRFTGWQWVDTVVAVAIGLWVLPRTWLLLKESLNILLEGVPQGVDATAIEATLLAVPGVASMHDFHVWALTSGRTSLTAHLVVPTLPEHPEVLTLARDALASRHGIRHATLQVEYADCGQTEASFA